MKSLLTLIGICLCLLTWGQQTEGKITFVESLKLEIDLPEEIKNSGVELPDKQVNNMELVFNANAGVYQAAPDLEVDQNEVNIQEEGVQIKMKFSDPSNIRHTDLGSRQVIQQREFMGKMFLISGERKPYKWKITSEQKQMDQFLCQKAVYTDSTQTIIAWFTPQIPVSLGPGNLGGLPGMILDADINAGETVYQVTEIVLDELTEDAISIPSKGKKVSREEFEEIVEAKTKELEESQGGGTVIKVIRN
ncbi:MAG: GLPGLI family protein [Bacteroidota bacterium]